jgi:hypothetical protein
LPTSAEAPPRACDPHRRRDGNGVEWARGAAQTAGVKTGRHLLGHMTITRLAEENVDERTVLEIANWFDPNVLRCHATKSDPNLQRAVSIL